MKILKIVLLIIGISIATACPPANASGSHSVTLTWVSHTTYPTPVFKVYKSTGAAYSVINTTSLKAYVDTNVLPNHRYSYYVTETDGTLISPISNKQSVVIP